ncbi:hypothetical protein D770_03530 [Flammeovirgaceae bacterium 311]|nr:hypothetical protein D770_03530 [Flammeovirgaceae bacterium 311]
MEKPDDNINDWLKAKIEDNSQQPPEAAWQHISESLDLENSWSGIEQDLELDNLWTSIDNRLQRHDQLLWWEKAGKAVTGAMAAVVVMIPLFLQLQHTDKVPQLAEQQQTSASAPADAPYTNASGKSIENTLPTGERTGQNSAGLEASGIDNGAGGATADAFNSENEAGGAGADASAVEQGAGRITAPAPTDHRNGGITAAAPGKNKAGGKAAEASAKTVTDGILAENIAGKSNAADAATANAVPKSKSKPATMAGRYPSGAAARNTGSNELNRGGATGAATATTAENGSGRAAENAYTGNNSAKNGLAHAVAPASGSEEGTLITTKQHQLYETLTGIPAELILEEGLVDANVAAVETEETVVPVADKQKFAGGWRAGAGLSGRMSWLMNQKTLSAMDKSSLTTSLPAYRKSFFLQAEKGLSPKLALLTDLTLYSEAGQRYDEYQDGMYGTTDTKLIYSNLSVLAAYNPRGRALLRRPHTRFLAGVSGGWLHGASMKGPAGESSISDEYKKTAAALIMGYEYNFPLSRRLWLNYGIRGQLDIMNIYAGSPEIPAKFRQTHSTYLDFVIGFKYEL